MGNAQEKPQVSPAPQVVSHMMPWLYGNQLTTTVCIYKEIKYSHAFIDYVAFKMGSPSPSLRAF